MSRLRRLRVPRGSLARVASIASVAGAFIVVSGAGTSLPDNEGRPARPAASPAVAPASQATGADLSTSRDLPLAEVRDHYATVQLERAEPDRVQEFLPLYRQAARTFGVGWRLIASIHRQETAFSASETTYHGLNFAGCCAGPMQFNVTNGPVSTWESYRTAYRSGTRPLFYPHPTTRHPSVYDDFDAIMAAGMLLRDSGSDDALGRAAWYAAYAYYGHDLFGITYANQVIARARGWRRDGFCVNCAVDDAIAVQLDARFGERERLRLATAEQRQRARRAAARARKRRQHERRVEERRRRKRAQARKDRREASPPGADKPRKRGPQRPARTPAPAPGKQRPGQPRPTATPAPPSDPARPQATPDPTRPPATPTPTPGALDGLLGGGGSSSP